MDVLTFLFHITGSNCNQKPLYYQEESSLPEIKGAANPQMCSLFILAMCISLQRISKVYSLSSGKVAATPILESVPLQFLLFFSLNYSLAARLQKNSRPRSPTKIETKRKLHQFTVSEWLIMNGERVVVKKEKL